eukprot:2587574-Rhodomonas_salina.2
MEREEFPVLYLEVDNDVLYGDVTAIESKRLYPREVKIVELADPLGGPARCAASAFQVEVFWPAVCCYGPICCYDRWRSVLQATQYRRVSTSGVSASSVRWY